MKDTPNKIIYGLNQDRHPSEQPNGTVRFVLNGVKGVDGNYHNERANTDCLTLDSDYNIVGSIYIDGGDKVIFATNETTSKIILLSSDCVSTEIVSSDDLGFSVLYPPITGEYRTRKGCNRTIYWCDGNNRDMYLDLDDLDDFKTDGVFDVNKMRFNPNITIPKFDSFDVNETGGNLATGSYRFQVEYVDSNNNSFYRSPTSQPIIVYGDNQFQSYPEINGNNNIDNFLAEVGGEPNTNKSITLNISNLDTTFDFIKINVFRNITGLANTIDSHTIELKIPIDQSTLEYTYTGFNVEQGDILEDVNSLLSLPVNYSSSLVMEQVQDRLIRANLKQFSKDYSTYQRTVNNITPKWVVRRETPFDQNENHNPKNPSSYVDGNTFIGDEIYAAGISFIHDDGTESPVFHIPGPEATGYDTTELTVGTNIPLEEVKHLGKTTGQTVQRWEAYNTASANGKLGYYESPFNYPTTVDCNEDYIYGDLAGTPIRHIKMPTRRYVPIQTTENNTYIAIQHLGLEFQNITYPDDSIIGHRFHLVKHNDLNRTVLDTGLLTTNLNQAFTGGIGEDNAYTIGNTIEHPQYTYIDRDKFGFISPRVLLGDYLNSSYAQLLGEITRSSFYQETETYDTAPGNSQYYIRTRGLEYINSITPTTEVNLNITNSILTEPRSRSTGVFDKPVVNESYSNNLMFLQSTRSLVLPYSKVTLATLKNDIDPFVNLDSLVYYPITEMLTLTDSQQVFNGGGFLVEFEFMNTYSAALAFGPGVVQGDYPIISDYINKVWVETTFNYNLLNNGTDCQSRYVQGNKFGDYIINKVATYNDQDDDWNSRSFVCKEYYNYNLDFNQKYSLTAYKSIPSNYDYCNECLDTNPNRIIFSPKSFQEELTDYYRVNIIDDYIDIPSNRGEITGLKYKNNKLYVHTTQTTFILQPNPQFIATDQNNAYLNTGDFLSIPPLEIMQTDTGYGGMQNKLGASNCEWGYVWADSLKNKVYRLTNNIEELSRIELFDYFKNNMSFKLDKFYKSKLKIEYPYKDNPYYIDGIGITTAYDPYDERVIISVKDYIVKDELFEGVVDDINRLGQNIKELKLYLDQATGKFAMKAGGVIKYPNLTNSLYFCNASWTISFSFRDNKWASWHSYLPNILLFDNEYFYSSANNKLLKHYSNKYLTFNNKKYEYILGYVINDYQTDNLSAIHYYADFKKDGVKVNDNYTNLLVYNTNQSTGKLTLVNSNQVDNPYEDLILDNMTKSIITTDNNSKITNLWDYSTANKIYSTDCRDLGSEFIDLVPVNIDYSKSVYEAGDLRDKYAIVRLYYYPDDNEVDVTHIISNTQEINSIR